jgi:hypothetical protein
MSFPKRVCAICSEEFELRPGKPGLSIHCPACSEEQEKDTASSSPKSTADAELNAARRKAMRELLYRKDS